MTFCRSFGEKNRLKGNSRVNKLVSAVWFNLRKLVLLIIFGEQDLELEMFCPIHKQN